MPARLADGLGLESDLGHGYPRLAPRPQVLAGYARERELAAPEEFGFPALNLQEGRPT